MKITTALVPPGFVSSAKMHSLYLEKDIFYVICTGPGPASIIDYTQGLLQMRQAMDPLKNLAVTAVINRYVKSIGEVEAQITPENLPQWAAKKGGFSCPASAVTSFKVDDKGNYIKLEITAAEKKFKFDCSIVDREAIKEMASRFK